MVEMLVGEDDEMYILNAELQALQLAGKLRKIRCQPGIYLVSPFMR